MNQAPAFTSAGTASVAENSTGTAYQAAATDPDGNAVSYRIEGADAARFTISSTGAISFTAAPNFEAPTDADTNNVYQLTVVASDGSLEARLNLAITVTNVADQLVAVRTNATGAFITSATGTARMFHGGGGEIHLYDPATNTSQLYLTVTGVTVLNAVAAPDYATSGLLYLYGVNASGQVEIRRYGRLPSGLGDPASADILLAGPNARQSLRGSSQGGGLAFGPDNLLYIGIGLGDGAETAAQDLASLNGKILRVDVSRDDFPADPNRDYAIPSGNPGFAAREILAYGFDDPRRMSFDGSNLYIGEVKVGGGSFAPNEEINLLRRQDIGANYGHPNEPPPNPNDYDRPGVTPPVISLRLSSTNIPEVVGGLVYRGPIPELNERYVFSSTNNSGDLLTVPVAAIVQGQTIRNAGVDSSLNTRFPEIIAGIRAFAVDSSGNLYLSNGYVLRYQ